MFFFYLTSSGKILTGGDDQLWSQLWSQYPKTCQQVLVQRPDFTPCFGYNVGASDQGVAEQAEQADGDLGLSESKSS